MAPRMTRAALPALVMVGSLVAGCEQHQQSPPRQALECGKPAAMAIAIGARANSPAQNLPEPVSTLVTTSANAGHRVVVVRLDGAPEVVHDESFVSTTQNDVKRQQLFNEYLDRLGSAFTDEVRATAAEADPFDALTKAAQATEPGDTVVLADSGLQTVAPLRFQDDQGILLESEPADIVNYLRDELRVLPDLRQRAVLLAGLGNTTPPQQRLNTRQRNNLIAIWRAIAEASGASCVQVFDDALQPHAVPDVPSVAVVPIASDPPLSAPCGETVLADNNGVGFVADQDVFKDQAAARATIKSIAEAMRQGRQRARITGTTANHGPLPGQIALSVRRAEAVKRVLVGEGIAEDRITTQGVGSRWPGYVPDIGPNGTLLPGPAAANRKVIVDLTCE